MRKEISNKKYFALDLFAGCGGLSQGLKEAGFKVLVAIEIDSDAAAAYSKNHPETKVIKKDLRQVSLSEINKVIDGKNIDVLAGCPPCQGFSSIRRLNKKRSFKDSRNRLILDYLHFVKKLKPKTIMLENVPALKNYYLFKYLIRSLKKAGYQVDYKIIDIDKYGVPQRRRRLVVIGSLLGKIEIAPETNERVTVRDAIGYLEQIKKTTDPLHNITVKHSKKVIERIRLIPFDGGCIKTIPNKLKLNCHKNRNIGFGDVYGRLRWDDVSSTITGGCLNPSKGRFLHPSENRVITPREAALLQSFPMSYKFPLNISKDKLGMLIGNALPPKFSYIQSLHIMNHLKGNCD